MAPPWGAPDLAREEPEFSNDMAEALRRADKPVELIELQGEDHWLSRSVTRRQMLVETVRFLEANNPPR